MTQWSISKSKVHKLTVYSRHINYKECIMDQNVWGSVGEARILIATVFIVVFLLMFLFATR